MRGPGIAAFTSICLPLPAKTPVGISFYPPYPAMQIGIDSYTQTRSEQAGLLAGLGTYIIWGALPIYWKMLGFMDPVVVMLHRVLWSFLFLLILELRKQALRTTLSHLMNRHTMLVVGLRSLLLSLNWLFFIWAVVKGHIVEASLGYFLNPIVSTLAGVLFFKERPSTLQWLSIILAFSGVSLQIVLFGDVPWIAIFLGLIFAVYGSMRKADNHGSLEGLFQETIIIMPVVVVLLGWYAWNGDIGLSTSAGQTLLIACSGVFTSVPLLLFAYSAQRLHMTTIGLLQYIDPSLNMLIGVFLYGEIVSRGQMVSFAFIWLALVIFSFESLRLHRKAVAFNWRG